MAGRKPKSPELRAAQGLRSHKAKKPPAAAVAPVVSDQVPEKAESVVPPAWLSPTARKIWRYAAPALLRRGLLTDADAIGFARYCEWLREYLAIQRSRKSNRKVVSTTKSKHTKNMQRIDKSFQALTIVDKQLLYYEDRLGMNPRERLAIMSKMALGVQHPPPAPPRPPGTPENPDQLGGRLETPAGLAHSPIGILNTRPH